MKYLDTNTNTYKEIYARPSGDTLPIGTIITYAGNNIPTNWLLCDGSAISRTQYSVLFNTIGTAYGSGDGSTTFNLPNNTATVTGQKYIIKAIQSVGVVGNVSNTINNTSKTDTYSCKYTDDNFVRISTMNGNIYYYPGDTFTLSDYIVYAGLITSNAQSVVITVPVTKSLANITTITCTSLPALFRGVSGYLNSNNTYTNYVGLSGYTVTCAKASDNCVRINIDKNSSYTNTTNNTPVSAMINIGFELQFA